MCHYSNYDIELFFAEEVIIHSFQFKIRTTDGIFVSNLCVE